MNLFQRKAKIISLFCFMCCVHLPCWCTITVNSLAELLPYLDDDNVEVKMTPGTYKISAQDVISGMYGTLEFNGKSRILLLFSGNNSTYDFTDVVLNIETEVFRVLGNIRVHEIVVTGNNNVLKNLTMLDLGSEYDIPTKGALAVCMDGRDNLVEEFYMVVKGSYPYGYGDAFGKGGKATIRHRKHSALLIRGLRNHAKGCTIIHRSYGHGIFMQAASYPIIENCAVIGQMRKTDDMLAETSGPAFDIDFMTVWGYKLPKGYMLSLSEAGIRSYDAGETIIDGVVIQRGTDNPTVINCTVKYMRTGVSLVHSTGRKYVEGCKTIGCEVGYVLGTGTVVNCKADCTYGPVYSSAYVTDKNYNADITLIPARDPYYNGSKSVAYIGGSSHEVTLRGTSEALKEGLTIFVGGDKHGVRLRNGNYPSQNDFDASNLILHNKTKYPVLLSPKSSSVSVYSQGKVYNEGAANRVVKSE